jgi:hypothetical protein
MAEHEQTTSQVFLAISVIVPILIAVLVYQTVGGWTGPLLLLALFCLLYALAKSGNWTSASPIRVVRSRSVSELYLGLALMTAALIISWGAGLFISRAFLEMDGILIALCIFGVLMLVISTYRDWQ